MLPGRAASLLLTLVLAACAAAPPPAPEPAAAPDDRANPLLDLAEEALAQGDLETAEARFRRDAAVHPSSARARTGLGRVAFERRDLDAARGHFQAAAELSPDQAEPWLGLADVARVAGDVEAARAHLDQALSRNPSLVGAHARLAALTGPAPRPSASTAELAVELADAHPYDPRTLLGAGRLLAQAGQVESARVYLMRALWLADLHPASAVEAAEWLARIDPAWRQRRVVPVHVFADQILRAEFGWEFRLRNVWLAVSNALADALDTRFLPVSIEGFDSSGAGPDLDSIRAAVWTRARRVPASGILAAFTGQVVPGIPGVWKSGVAEFAGRRTTVRLDLASPAESTRVLAHELLHLYAGVHVAEDIESLMNPTGEALVLDGFNARIVRALRQRRFRDGGAYADILPWVDLRETTEALSEVLGANLTLRRLGLDRALRSSEYSRLQAAREWNQARQLDPHLGDVSLFLAHLELAGGNEAQAVMMLEVAEQLYGPGSARGRLARARADALRRDLRLRYGDGAEPAS
jgi:Tfp pilus assembly protein PilF